VLNVCFVRQETKPREQNILLCADQMRRKGKEVVL
jgi:hypothetical protein